jgi:hypothetical protein
LNEYISKVQKDGEIFPIGAWDEESAFAYPKIELDISGKLKPFHKFGCAVSQCDGCPR